MIPPQFEYSAPGTLDEAISLLGEHGPDAVVLAGGQSLIPLMKLQLALPERVVDINGISGLAGISEDDGFLRIGSLTREAALERSEIVQSRYPILYDTAVVIADPLVRNMATVGGNLAHGDPANDHPATMLALGAQVAAVGPSGERVIPVSDFFEGPLTTALDHGEILTEIRIPTPPAGSGGAYLKLERKVGDYAIAGVAAVVTVADGVCQQAGIGLTNAGETPVKAGAAESFLVGKTLDDDTIREAAGLASQAADPEADLRGSVEYKRDMVRVLAGRALQIGVGAGGLVRGKSSLPQGLIGAWASFDKLRTNDFTGLPHPVSSLEGEGAWVSFDKLRTNDLLVYLPLLALKGEGAWASFDKLRTNDLLVYLPRQLPRRRGGLGVLRQAQDERFTGLPTPPAPSRERGLGCPSTSSGRMIYRFTYPRQLPRRRGLG